MKKNIHSSITTALLFIKTYEFDVTQGKNLVYFFQTKKVFQRKTIQSSTCLKMANIWIEVIYPSKAEGTAGQTHKSIGSRL